MTVRKKVLILMNLILTTIIIFMGYNRKFIFYREVYDSCATNQCFMTQNNTCDAWSKITRNLDNYFESEWPRMDLMIRSTMQHEDVLQYMFHSVDLFWPKNIGDIILILDKGEESMEKYFPPYVKIFYESFPERFPGRIGMQWSNLWADNYTNAEYVAIFDSDAIFTTYVSPDLFFKEKKLVMIGNPTFQKGMWTQASEWWIGEEYFNFMMQLPVVLSAKHLKKFREYAVAKRPEAGYFDNVLYSSHPTWWSFSQFCVYGNYLYQNHKDEFYWALEGTGVEPVLRMAQHIPYCADWELWPNRVDPNVMLGNHSHGHKAPRGSPKYSSKFTHIAMRLMNEGICASIPPGTFKCCQHVDTRSQVYMFQYVRDNLWGSSTQFDYYGILERHYYPIRNAINYS